MRSALAALLLLCLVLPAAFGAETAPLALFDFTHSAGAAEWTPAHDMADVRQTPDGLAFSITAGDPYMLGPARDYPAGQQLWASVRLFSEQGGTAQIFYYRNAPSEPKSVFVSVPAGQWATVQAPLPALGPGFHLRLDPPGSGGSCTVQQIEVTARISLQAPHWPVPSLLNEQIVRYHLKSGPLEVSQGVGSPGGFTLSWDGRSLASGYLNPPVVYLLDGKERTFRFEKARVSLKGRKLTAQAYATDPDGAEWTLTQTFRPGPQDTLSVAASISVNRPREALFVPLLLLFPGLGSYGPEKDQALFGGLEYLGKNEPSSSEADLRGQQAHREVPAAYRITVPLMTIVSKGLYLALAWHPDPDVAALFDTPDRLFGSGAQVMGLICPGSDGHNRDEASLMPYAGLTLSPGISRGVSAEIMGGEAKSVVPSLEKYVALEGLPALPQPGYDADAYLQLAAAGWLGPGIGGQSLFRHAYPDFPRQPAADAALGMEYAAGASNDPVLSAKLKKLSEAALAAVPPGQIDEAGIGHVRYPYEALVTNAAGEGINELTGEAKGLLQRFTPQGLIEYAPAPGAEDLAATNGSHSSNGITVQAAGQLLQDAAASGDKSLIQKALRIVNGLKRYSNHVPRGAQPWEVPLHVPDILASAYFVRTYALAYQLTGEEDMLDEAKYWAWTGVPFVMLWNPFNQPIGPYATTAVYGATHWTAPDWMGRPVQWCGLVYADALYHLAEWDSTGPWKKIADGITVSGIQQTWPVGRDEYRAGLLPDSFNLESQTRNDPAINPTSLFPEALHYFGMKPLYTLAVSRKYDVIVQAPGSVVLTEEDEGKLKIVVNGWPAGQYQVLITGLTAKPAVNAHGLLDSAVYTKGRLTLTTQGRVEVTLTLDEEQ